MITQKEFIEQHRKHLDNEFVKKHPEGQFVIQQRNSGTINIYVNFKRRAGNTLHCFPHSFGIECANEKYFYFISHQNNGFDKTVIYKTLDNFLIECRKHLIKENVIKEFLFFYNQKNDTKFVQQTRNAKYFCEKVCSYTVPNSTSDFWASQKNKEIL